MMKSKKRVIFWDMLGMFGLLIKIFMIKLAGCLISVLLVVGIRQKWGGPDSADTAEAEHRARCDGESEGVFEVGGGEGV